MNKKQVDYPSREEKEQSIQFIKNHIQITVQEDIVYKEKKHFKPLFISSFVFLSLALFTVLYFTGSLNKRAKPYHISLMQQKVLTTQYLPNIRRMASRSTTQDDQYPYDSLQAVEKTITLDNFNGIIDTIGDIDNPFNREFTVTDIKDEVYFVIGHVPYFNKWVRIDGNGQGIYYVSYDEETQHITIMRKSGFQPWIYDTERNEALMNDDFVGYPSNKPISEDVFYKIDYYYDELGREVVEAEIVSFLDYFDKSEVSQYQYVKNIKDTSFTKYIITPMGYVSTNQNDGSWGYDITSNNPLGTSRQFIQIDYVNPEDVSLLFIKQGFSSAFNDDFNHSQVQFYRKLNDDLLLYNTVYTYGIDEYLNDASFITYNPLDSVFDFYVTCNDYHNNSGMAGTPDKDYINRSSDRIKSLNRELYYNDGNKTVTIWPSEYYLDNEYDDPSLINKLSYIPFYLNTSLNQLATNSYTSQIEQDEIMDMSPSYLDLYDQTKQFKYEHFIDQYLNKISQNIVNHSYLANTYKTAQSRVILAIVVGNVDQLSDMSTYIELNDINSQSNLQNNIINIDASATINKSILLKPNGTYSLGLIAKGEGNSVIIIDDGELIKYRNKNLELNLSTNYNLSHINSTLDGSYQIGVALIYHNNDYKIICSELVNPNYTTVENLNNYKHIDSGFEIEYQFKYTNNQLFLNITKTDIENPTITLDGLSNQVYTVEHNTTVEQLFKKLSVNDNDKIASFSIQNSQGQLLYLNDILQEESYTITVSDSQGNTSSLEFRIEFN